MIKIAAAALFATLATMCSTSHADDFGVLPVVTVTDEYNVDFNDWGGYSPWFSPGSYFSDAAWDWLDGYWGTHMEAAILSQISNLTRSTSVCIALISGNAKSTTSTSDVTTRWLAAQEVFNYINNAGMLSDLHTMTRTLTFIMDGKSYQGFRVAYADGVRETWAINPNYKYSSVKLLDQPLPNSQEPYTGEYNTPKCNQG